MSHEQQPPVILDCTIRDGNYAVDFKFTESDTQLLVNQLANLGIKWLEVGHGLGLGACESGEHSMPSDDLSMIRSAKAACRGAKIGAFFLPGIGSLDHIKKAADAGLDFLRIGSDWDDVDEAITYLIEAKRLGLTACLNIMKTYAATPRQFSEKARLAEDAGADVVYCVDSAGCMLPHEVGEYFDAARDAVSCQLGFHGHNNLMLVIDNCIVAYEHGATFLDATLCGLGRSAGNAPTEILIAVLKRLGIHTEVDLFALMDVIDECVWPLVSSTRPHDMMAVTAGYSRFHSSFLPRVSQAARSHKAEVRRVVASVAEHDPVNLDEQYLDQVARELSGTATRTSRGTLVDFDAPLDSNRISNTMMSVHALLQGMEVIAAKRSRTTSVLHLVPTASPVHELVMPELVVEDERVVMGRVVYGSLDALKQIVEAAVDRVSLFLVSQSEGWSAEAESLVRGMTGESIVRTVRDREVKRGFVSELLDQAAESFGRQALLIYKPDQLLRDVIQAGLPFDSVFIYGMSSAVIRTDGVIVLNDWNDWNDLMLRFDVIICGANSTQADTAVLCGTLASDGRLLSVSSPANQDMQDQAGARLVQVDLNKAYVGLVDRLLAVEKLLCQQTA